MNIHKHYIRFLVWLGAEPPLDDRTFQETHTIDGDSDLPSLSSLRKEKFYNLLKIAIIFPILLFLILAFFLAGDWRTGLIISGVLAGIILFAVSFLFQAVVVLVGAIFMFSQGHWLIGLALLALTVYLIFAATLRDEDMARSFMQIRTISPHVYNRLSEHIAQSNNPALMFRKYFKVFLIVFGVAVVIYGCQGLITIGSLILDLPCPDSILPDVFCSSR